MSVMVAFRNLSRVFGGRGKRNINMFFMGPPDSGKTVFWTMLGLAGTNPGYIEFYEPDDILNVARGRMPIPGVLPYGKSQKILDAFKEKILSQNEWPDKTLIHVKHRIDMHIGRFIIVKKINDGEEFYQMKKLGGTFQIAPIDIPGDFVEFLDNAFDNKVFPIDPIDIKKLYDSIRNVLREMIKKPENFISSSESETKSQVKDTSSASANDESKAQIEKRGLFRGKKKPYEVETQTNKPADPTEIGMAAEYLHEMIENPPKTLIITLRAKSTGRWGNATIGVTSRVIPRLLYAMTRNCREPINVAILLTAAVFDEFIEEEYVTRLVEDSIRLEEYQEVLREKFSEFRRKAGGLINPLVYPKIEKIRFIGLYPYDACIDLQRDIDPKTGNVIFKPKLTDENKLRSFGILTFIYNIMNVIQGSEPLIPPEIWYDSY
ncbi:MAG: hypothetical protein J7K59_00590 [Candidatus Korarchaeota archaeon]|nr:hypothetical protein [Candidatus Korarchaeota archaeon]